MEAPYINFDKYNKLIERPCFRRLGKVVNMVGLTIESAGPDARLEIGRAHV